MGGSLKKKALPTRRATTAKSARVLIMRTCAEDGSSSHGFVWPLTVGAKVVAPDWEPTNACGNGLHGWLWGVGDSALGDFAPPNKTLVVSADAADVIDLDGKVKFPRCVVEHIGDLASAAAYLLAHGAAGKPVIGGTATAGRGGTATAGDGGTATAGYFGTATAGDRGTATAGYFGTATAGDRGTATAGDSGTATAGYCGTATAGDGGTATAGYCGTATAGYCGTATAGRGGTATAGDGGTATAGDGGVIVLRHWDSIRYRVVIGAIGEDGLDPNVAYRLDDQGKFIEATVTQNGAER